jgi:hypothetical protein
VPTKKTEAALRTLLADVAAVPSTADLFNQLRDEDPTLDARGAAAIRRANALTYLRDRHRPSALLVGEAIGYQGGRFSGIAFTSERQLLAWGAPFRGSSTKPGGWAEPSATIIHGVLADLDLERRCVLWNTVPFHPHPRGRPLANRAPRRGEVELGLPFLDRLLTTLAPERVIAIGRVAERALGDRAEARVRHPAQGGATACREGLRALLG